MERFLLLDASAHAGGRVGVGKQRFAIGGDPTVVCLT
jgi:hypothetical protein